MREIEFGAVPTIYDKEKFLLSYRLNENTEHEYANIDDAYSALSKIIRNDKMSLYDFQKGIEAIICICSELIKAYNNAINYVKYNVTPLAFDEKLFRRKLNLNFDVDRLRLFTESEKEYAKNETALHMLDIIKLSISTYTLSELSQEEKIYANTSFIITYYWSLYRGYTLLCPEYPELKDVAEEYLHLRISVDR